MKFQKLDLPKLDFSGIIGQINSEQALFQKAMDEVAEERKKRYNDKVYREKRMVELLESIDKNTSVLMDMVSLLEENTKDQKIILEIINDFNTLATINDKEKGQSLYRNIMNKINTSINDVNTITTLYSYGMIILNILQTKGYIYKCVIL